MNKDGFKIPDNYFEQFPNELMLKIAHKRKKKKIFQFSVISSVAASVLIVFLSVYVMYNQESTNAIEDCQLSEIDYFGIEMNDIYDICENTNKPSTNLENTEIIDFLDNDELDYEWIINE